MAQCKLCGRKSPLIASSLALCVDCIRQRPTEALPLAREVHRRSRRQFNLPEVPPDTPAGKSCHLCSNQCRMGEGETGYCGLRSNEHGVLKHHAGTPAKGLLHWYFDPLPTNCVADWVCAGHTRYGYKNLAVFYGACTFNCLFCQNWHYREMSPHGPGLSAAELAACADQRTFCVCYFGGDPTPQMAHALAASRLLAERGIRICWETNGSMHPALVEEMVELSLHSGGCIKFDLKAWNEDLHRALTGSSNERTLQNFATVAAYIHRRPQLPLLIASTLLVPGYVDVQEVRQLAAFIASLDPSIPYALLGFYPHFYIHDLPTTSVRHAEEALAAAQEVGLHNVRIGNRHLLSHAY
ncbi:MAG: radical SAM protein [Chloroflexi bacterium]|nr:radical SAM protein [Chloroflexota bacterium]